MIIDDMKTEIIKRIMYTTAALSFVVSVSSCKSADELPPLNEGYETEFVLPDPVDLTADDRAFIDELEQEYKQAIGQ